MVNFPSQKANMTWLGEDKDATIMAAYNNSNFNGSGDTRMLIRASANGFRMYNMTYHNLTPKGGGQAETIKHSGQQSIVKNCKFMSYQDTLCLNGQMYLKDCYIEGDTDYIWGYGATYFDKCEMHSMSTKSHVTQPRAGPPPANGFFIVDCNLTAAPGITQCDLGRTTDSSYPYCQSVYINCTMPNGVFLPAGWTNTYLTDTSHLRWWEYKSVDPCGNLIDVNSRVSYSKQLDDNDIDINDNGLYWRDANHVFGNWNPQNLGELPTASWQPFPADGATGVDPCGITLTWAAGAEVESHIVYFGTAYPLDPNDPCSEQAERSFATGAMSPETTYYWGVDENNPAGVTAGTVWSFTTSYICTGSIASDLNSDCEVDFVDYSLLADAWEGDLTDIAQFASDWLKCHREPASECWQ